MQLDILPTKQAVLYLRVSSEEQVENYSLETQEDICKREALRRGFAIAEVFREEGRSAKTITGRPELLKMLDYCRRNKRGIDAVFVYRLDRLSRQTQDYLTIRKKLFDYDISLISANEPTGNSPTEKLLETIMASFAQHDNDVRSERTRNGLRARFFAGLFSGKPPLGYIMQHGYVVKDTETFEKMKRAWDLMLTGTKSLSEMATIMNEWGLREVKAGKEYHLRAQTVNRLFRYKFYAGILSSKRYPDEVKGQHAAMITEEQFYKVQAIIDGRNTIGMTVGKKLKDNPDFPLRRIVKCSRCAGPLTGAWSKGRNKKYAYYICKNRCGCPSIAVKTLDDSLIQFLREITPPKEKLDVFLLLVRKTFHANMNILRARKEKAQQEIMEIEKLEEELVMNHLKKVYTDEVYQTQSAKLKHAKNALKVVLADSTFYKYTIDDVEKFMYEKFKDLGQTYLDSEPGEQRVLLGSICPTGLSWQYPGLSNQQFSPEYQAILDVQINDLAHSIPGGIRTHD